MYRFVILLALFFTSAAHGHQFTPAYPELRNSWMPGVWMTELKLFNKREEISYYEFSVFDKEWNAIKFATPQRVQKIPYLVTENIEIYIKDEDVEKALYICSTSKLLKTKGGNFGQAISSRICSKIKK